MMTGVRRFWSSRSDLDAERFGRWNEAVKRGEKEFFMSDCRGLGSFAAMASPLSHTRLGAKSGCELGPVEGGAKWDLGVAATLWVTVGVYVFPRRPCGEMGGMGAGSRPLPVGQGARNWKVLSCSKSENREACLVNTSAPRYVRPLGFRLGASDAMGKPRGKKFRRFFRVTH